MTTALADRFAHEPLASDSAQFPLARPACGPAAFDVPSAAGVRPWGLGGMRTAQCQGDPVRAQFTYDHARQIAVDGQGRELTIIDATASSNTDKDGDEGPSEDWKYDFAPDQPLQV